jgi:transposase-like protein
MDTSPPKAERQRALEKRKGRLSCPFCEAYEVQRLFVASVKLDSCLCSSCGAGWDEELGSGEYRGRSHTSSVLIPEPD